MKITKGSGPNTDPCSTPLITSIHSENAHLTPNLCLLSFSQFYIHLNRLPPNLLNLITFISAQSDHLHLFTQSYVGNLVKCFCKNQVHLFKNSNKFIKLDLPFVNPCRLLSYHS